jgi:hypothetical protein
MLIHDEILTWGSPNGWALVNCIQIILRIFGTLFGSSGIRRSVLGGFVLVFALRLVLGLSMLSNAYKRSRNRDEHSHVHSWRHTQVSYFKRLIRKEESDESP